MVFTDEIVSVWTDTLVWVGLVGMLVCVAMLVLVWWIWVSAGHVWTRWFTVCVVLCWVDADVCV